MNAGAKTMGEKGDRSELVWRAKLAAWTHDPAEKALVLLRDPGGHTGGTVTELREIIFGSAELAPEIHELVRTADQWASGADRPHFPKDIRVRFDSEPKLIHPLDGRIYDLVTLEEVGYAAIRSISLAHFKDLIIWDDEGKIDFKRTFLSFWLNGSSRPAPDLGALWQVLPADTRVPIHSIWEHLNLTSALAGAMKADPKQNVALLKISIGPVQSFIEQSRTTSDLWAGSHLLSRTMWEGLKVLCNELGPDCVLFPDLHGLPFVDVWLQRECGIKITSSRLKEATDKNSLFVAALVNLAVAVVPESAATELARKMTEKMRDWILGRARKAAQKIHEEAGVSLENHPLVEKQVEEHLRGCPETYWAVVPWRLATNAKELDVSLLKKVLARFYPERKEPPGFFASQAWAVLSNPVLIKEADFYRPNPGVVYPALYDLLDRSFAAAKSARPFEAIRQEGYRCTLCGEREWLTSERQELERPRGKRGRSIWQVLAEKRPSWVRANEYLCAVCTLKRLWPTLFLNEVAEYIEDKPSRFVVSTHTMALAPTLNKIATTAEGGLRVDKEKAFDELLGEIEKLNEDQQRVALPLQLYEKAKREGEVLKLVRGLPALLDQAAEEEQECGDSTQPGKQAGQRQAAASERRKWIEQHIEKLAGVKPERYYALILMDGDRMGAWVSGTADELLLPYEKTWHPSVLSHESLSIDELKAYRRTLHQSSPSRHVALSRALNGFSIHLVPMIVEELHAGKLLYAGGDDVMAMVGIDDLLDVMCWLRCAFSGSSLEEQAQGLRLGGGHALLSRPNRQIQLLRVMGERATASMGAVVTHYSAPLQAVLRELRQAEKRAKQVPGKDAFSVTLMKRAGGLTHFTAKWWSHALGGCSDSGQSTVMPAADCVPSTIAVLKDLRNAFGKLLSRQAPYQTLEWLSRLGEGADASMVESLIRREFRRHLKDDQVAKWADVERAAKRLAQAARAMHGVGTIPHGNQLAFIKDAINLAEFLAREGRAR